MPDVWANTGIAFFRCHTQVGTFAWHAGPQLMAIYAQNITLAADEKLREE